MTPKEKIEKDFKQTYFTTLGAVRNVGNFASVRLKDIQGGFNKWETSRPHIDHLVTMLENALVSLEECKVKVEELEWEKQREKAFNEPQS